MSVFPSAALSGVPQSFQAKAEALPLFQEYGYDYESNELKLRNGSTYLVSENKALQIWVYKALLTVRYRHLAYTRDFGVEFWSMIGQSNSSDIIQSEMQRYIIEALMVNPYILELYNFLIEVSGSILQVDFDCLTVYGEMHISYGFEGVATIGDAV